MVSHISNGSSSHFQVDSSKTISVFVPETLGALGRECSVVVQIKVQRIGAPRVWKDREAKAGVSQVVLAAAAPLKRLLPLSLSTVPARWRMLSPTMPIPRG